VLVTDLAQLQPFVERWRELAVRRENPHLTPEFFFSWAEHYAAHARPFVPIVLDGDGRLRGLLPLVVTTDSLRQVQFAGGDFWMALSPVAAVQDEEEVAAAAGRLLGEHRAAWRSVTLENAIGETRWLDRFAEALRDRCGQRLWESRRSHPWLSTDLSSGWSGFIAAKPSKFRSELRRAERRLREAHAIEARQVDGADELRDAIEQMFRFHHARRDALGGSTFDETAHRRTLEAFAQRAFDRGWTRLRVLEIDGEAAATNLYFRVGDRCVGYLLAWDPAAAPLGAGRMALVDGLRAAADEGVREFDLSVGHTEFKARHATGERRVETLWLYTRRTAMLFAVRRAGRQMLPDRPRRALGRRIRSAAGRVEMPS